jgi:hypothetical protein
MNSNIQRIIQQVGTDTSGKWINTSEIPGLIDLVIQDVFKYVGREDWRREIQKHFDPGSR